VILNRILNELFDEYVTSHEIVTKNGKTETTIKLGGDKAFIINEDGSVTVKKPHSADIVVTVPKTGYSDLIEKLTRVVANHEDVVTLFKSLKNTTNPCDEVPKNLEACEPALYVLRPASLTRGSAGAAGFDLVASATAVLEPGKVTKVPTEVRVAIPEGYVGLIMDRSSMGSKGFHVFGGVIDSDYRGELAVMLYNTTEGGHIIVPGERIAQMVVVPYLRNVLSVDSLTTTERGSNGFGSTGK
jgi:dUTP pyrophosphatase